MISELNYENVSRLKQILTNVWNLSAIYNNFQHSQMDSYFGICESQGVLKFLNKV